MTTITTVVFLITAPLFAGGTDNGAISALFGPADMTSLTAAAVPASPSEPAEKTPARNWDAEVKKTCRAYLENGRLFNLPEAEASRLPRPALRFIGQDGSKGPFGAAAYELMVGGLPAFVIHDTRGGAVVSVFDACGRLVAAGGAGGTSEFRWDDISSYPETNISCLLKAGGHQGQPDGPYDGGPDGGHYWDDHGGGPDSDYDGIDGGPGWDGVNPGGFDGSGSVPF